MHPSAGIHRQAPILHLFAMSTVTEPSSDLMKSRVPTHENQRFAVFARCQLNGTPYRKSVCAKNSQLTK